MKSWVKNGCFAFAAVSGLGLLVAFALGGTFLVQSLTTDPEETRLVQEMPSTGLAPGRIVLSLSSAAVTVKAGPAGGRIRVESNFDRDVHRLEQTYEEDGTGSWIYRLDFHEKRILHVSVVSIWLGRRSPEVMIEIPGDLPFALETKMEGGYLALDLAGLDLTTVGVELDRGVLELIVSEPLDIPIERLSVKGRMGAMVLQALGNASPKELDVQHGIGAAHVDLSGLWLRDADVDFQVAFGSGELKLPGGIEIEGLDRAPLRLHRPDDKEIPTPALHVSTHFDIGDIRVVD